MEKCTVVKRQCEIFLRVSFANRFLFSDVFSVLVSGGGGSSDGFKEKRFVGS